MTCSALVRPARLAAAALVLAAAAAPVAARAQESRAVAAPIPPQIAAARRLFISNAGSDSYGSDTYARLTKYEGGADRVYREFYTTMAADSAHEIVSEPAKADLVLGIRFSAPIVDRALDHRDFIYDPQLDLEIVDPSTRIVLWSLTEHIEPARSDAANNRHFDEAVVRLVARFDALAKARMAYAPGVAGTPSDAPIGAYRHVLAKARAERAFGGLLSGVFLSSIASASHVFGRSPDDRPGREEARAMIGFGAAGALIGALWPVHLPAAARTP